MECSISGQQGDAVEGVDSQGDGMSDKLLSKAVWMHDFLRKLAQLRPSMHSIAASIHAVEAWHAKSDADPVQAAEQFAQARYPEVAEGKRRA
jgi:hypothetical protein